MANNLKDHKEIGQELELFFSHDYAPGAPFWLPKGLIIFKELEKYIRQLTKDAGYQEISTPIMVKSQLFKESGHWEKFGEHNMYNLPIWENEEFLEIVNLVEDEVEKLKLQTGKYPFLKVNIKFHGENIPVTVGEAEIISNKKRSSIHEEESVYLRGVFPAVNYSLKPMNCPESTIIYRFKTRTYKDLPLRLSELGRLHRREKAGEVNGLLRVRQLTMDDAHIFASVDQIFDEVSSILDMMTAFYKKFGFEYEFRFATRPPQRAGKDEMWNEAEKDLEEVLKKKGIKAGDKKGDGAFYGPKIDVHIKDALGREWQLATVQLDFHMPQAFDLKYVNDKGGTERPVMIHRAIFGSFERFIGILTEHYQGAFPLWLSPVQVVILPITDKHNVYARQVFDKLEEAGIRAEVDDRSERLQAKIRDATLQKIPYLGIIGDTEYQKSNIKSKKLDDLYIAIRTREGKDEGLTSLSHFLQKVKSEIDKKV